MWIIYDHHKNPIKIPQASWKNPKRTPKKTRSFVTRDGSISPCKDLWDGWKKRCNADDRCIHYTFSVTAFQLMWTRWITWRTEWISGKWVTSATPTYPPLCSSSGNFNIFSFLRLHFDSIPSMSVTTHFCFFWGGGHIHGQGSLDICAKSDRIRILKNPHR